LASGEFLELKERAARAARFDATDSTDLTRAGEAVNQAYLTAVTRDGIQFDFLEQEGQWDCTAGSDVYTYADIATAIGVTGASVAEILWLTNDTDGSVLESRSWADLEKGASSSQNDDPSGCPYRWAKWASRIRLYPDPDQEYRFGTFVKLVPAEMSDDEDTPLIPLAYRHSVIVPLAASILLRMEGGSEAHQEAQFYQRQYEDAWMSMRTAHAGGRAPTFNLKSPGWDAPRDDAVSGDPYYWTR
jgi:GAF domain-containing protein